ncbi:probable ATP-dependent RNA helicase DDX20 isoform X2 [Cervus elaphus]|uniref:probable ATP-dependent RNA helicase DDX20 isoform X2 n=1 Tax=Cervus canadensis TaxID=1574408 RepID=UPI001C9E43CD|nr:probable ATP-dependent RNA helicase DDX20 isoform X2 [Cervus canadensis]XP_043733053.1 probable ATP-dependent RNA helicase DDX20 isoform X2 [Cervus elaphus]
MEGGPKREGTVCTLQTMRIYFQFLSLDSGVSGAGKQQYKRKQVLSTSCSLEQLIEEKQRHLGGDLSWGQGPPLYRTNTSLQPCFLEHSTYCGTTNPLHHEY